MDCLFVIGHAGDVLFRKQMVGTLPSSTLPAKFWDSVLAAASPNDVPPILNVNKWYLIHVQYNGMFFVGGVQREMSPLLGVEFFYRLIAVLQVYVNPLNEEMFRDRLVVIYQLLDEMLDHGFPFNTEPNILTEMIPPSTFWSDWADKLPLGDISAASARLFGAASSGVGSAGISGSGMTSPAALPSSLPTNIYWRAHGVRHTVNEIFFDLTERLDCIVDNTGRALKASCRGHVDVNCKLSGMPDLTLYFGNARVIDDVAFHPCVRYHRWDQNSVVSFVPPDGPFQLMTYRVASQSVDIPVWVRPQITHVDGGGRVSLTVGVRPTLPKVVEDLMLTVQFSKKLVGHTLTASFGLVQFDEASKTLRWKIGKMGKDPLTLSGALTYPSGSPPPSGQPLISVSFKINQWVPSSLRVDNLVIHGESYKPFKGVRTVTETGAYVVRP